MNHRAESSDQARSRRQALGSTMFSEQAWAELTRSLTLSPRELQIVRSIFDGRTEFAAASDIGISPHTVHTYIERLHRKLAVPDRVGLILRVTDEFLKLTASPDNDLPSICPNRIAGRCPLQSQQPITAHAVTTPLT